MNHNDIIQATEEFVKDAVGDEGTGHDWWHVVRVRNSARLINEIEKGDWFVIELALLLHDVGDRKVIHKENDDYSIAENFLVRQKVSSSVIDQVMFIIKNMSFSKSLNNKKSGAPIEFYIVQDADRLDAIGAIGVARAFAFGGSRARLLYDPEYSPQLFTSSEAYKNATSSTLHHFDEKLFLIKDLLNTQTAKSIAKERDKFMKTFKQQFLDEWEGKK